MKKLFLILVSLLTINTSFSQVATKTAQDTMNARAASINAKTLINGNTLKQIDSLGIIKTVTVSCVSTNTASAYSTGQTITGTLTPHCFSVYVGTGSWQVMSIAMYPSASISTLAINISVFTASLTSGGADKTTFTTTTTFNKSYVGSYQFVNIAPFGGSQIYETSKALASTLSSNIDSFYLTPDAAGNIYFVLWANAGFTPTTGATYNFKFNLKRTN